MIPTSRRTTPPVFQPRRPRPAAARTLVVWNDMKHRPESTSPRLTVRPATTEVPTNKTSIGVGDRGARGVGGTSCPPLPQKWGQYFSGNYHVQFWEYLPPPQKKKNNKINLVNFLGKYHVKFGHFVNLLLPVRYVPNVAKRSILL